MLHTGGPAFPHIDSGLGRFEEGMTLRDYFAAKALQGVMACNGIYEDEKKLAQWCYEQADAMLEIRERK
jgi:hypothetical protein